VIYKVKVMYHFNLLKKYLWEIQKKVKNHHRPNLKIKMDPI